jgi:hypothetical protein
VTEKHSIRGDETDRREVRTILTETGHRTLNALLIVSGGATVAFISFLGEAVKQGDLAARIGPTATRSFAQALTFFFLSVLFTVLAHGMTYASHAAHLSSATSDPHSTRAKRLRDLGVSLMWVTVFIAAASVTLLWRGGFSAINGFAAVADVLTRSSVR